MVEDEVLFHFVEALPNRDVSDEPYSGFVYHVTGALVGDVDRESKRVGYKYTWLQTYVLGTMTSGTRGKGRFGGESMGNFRRFQQRICQVQWGEIKYLWIIWWFLCWIEIEVNVFKITNFAINKHSVLQITSNNI